MRLWRYGWIVVLLLGFVPVAQAQEALCFKETNRCISGRIREYWERNGGLPVFGLPINAPRQEINRDTQGSYATQWFERNRIELHPENRAPFDVLLGRLGAEALPADLPEAARRPEAGPQAGCRWFEVTKHNLCNQSGPLGFKSYWESHGLDFAGQPGTSYDESLALLGYPLTSPVMHTNSSGDTVLTQWFERARFEWHPANPDQFKVLLGRAGSEIYDPASATGAPRYHSVQQSGWPFPLEVQHGFTVEEAYAGLNGPRFMAIDPTDSSLVVANRDAGSVIRLRDLNQDGRYDQQQTIADGMTYIHSIAFMNGMLFAADEHRLMRLADVDATGRARQITTILDLPSGATDLYGHRTRTVLPGPDGYLYVSVGSSCDVCVETSAQRAVILRLRPDGSGVQIFATGLRNAVGIAWQPYTNALWAADMGRNNIGPGIPPDELNLIEQGKNYGWPYCYGDNLPNPEFNDPSRCVTPVKPAWNFPAHWAPLGLLFYDRTAFPASFQSDALVAFHGTAADQVPEISGFRVSRIRFENHRPVGMEDLVRGWNRGQTVWGRPAGLLLLPDGSLLISDDANGRIYRVRATGG